MPKKNKKQKSLFKLRLGSKKVTVTKQRLEVFILAALLTLVAVAQVSGLYPYVYNYAICKDAPIEVRGDYYRVSGDENYGIHIGSDYSRCYGDSDMDGLERDPSTKAAKQIKAAKEKERARVASISDYTVYRPEGYEISSYRRFDAGDRLDTSFRVTTDTGTEFNVSQVKKGSSYDYTGICYKPATENWSGEVIGKDQLGREICKTNYSKYVTDYTVGIYIADTAIVLRAKNVDEASLKNESTKIFSSMKPSNPQA